MLYLNTSYKFLELDELEQIQYNYQAESGLASLPDKMPVGAIKINEETNEVEWFNPYAELIFSTDVMGTLMLNLKSYSILCLRIKVIMSL